MLKRLLPCLLLPAMLVGCTTYYKVTDPTTGKVYYTTDIRDRDGTREFTDAATRAKVTIQNSEIVTISQKDYDAALRSK